MSWVLKLELRSAEPRAWTRLASNFHFLLPPSPDIASDDKLHAPDAGTTVEPAPPIIVVRPGDVLLIAVTRPGEAPPTILVERPFPEAKPVRLLPVRGRRPRWPEESRRPKAQPRDDKYAMPLPPREEGWASHKQRTHAQQKTMYARPPLEEMERVTLPAVPSWPAPDEGKEVRLLPIKNMHPCPAPVPTAGMRPMPSDQRVPLLPVTERRVHDEVSRVHQERWRVQEEEKRARALASKCRSTGRRECRELYWRWVWTALLVLVVAWLAMVLAAPPLPAFKEAELTYRGMWIVDNPGNPSLSIVVDSVPRWRANMPEPKRSLGSWMAERRMWTRLTKPWVRSPPVNEGTRVTWR
ncbi:hypothetical protein BV25DRAFT_1918998 [Artomyces pyxidatus]|uniref:Uncharacterized protein n=1 Tax=Artomyces pyxidatus TaxID=48021 RepID=A0ACB8SSF7_9AGAM|nr:hypothetical protein BV25DRAFT_1918998 [Artomyces pyxidatus]